MESEKIVEKKKRKNILIYIIYKMFSYDLLFYYAVSMIFLNSVKGLTFAQIIFADSFFPFFKVIFQIPTTLFVEKNGKRSGLIFGNLCLVIYMLFILGCNSCVILLIADFIGAIGFAFKNSCESNLLYDSIPKSNDRHKKFSKIEGRSSALYYAFEAISCIASGLLYTINPYIPMVLALICTIISTLLAHQFSEVPEDISNENEDHYKTKSTQASLRHYIRNLKNAFRFIFSSGRLKSLIFYNAYFMSLIYLFTSYRRSMLSEIGINAKIIGIVFAILGLLAAVSSAQSIKFNKKLKNKTLTYFGIYYVISILISGIVVVLKIPFNIAIPIIIIMFGIQYIIKGPYQTLIKQYLSSFSTSSMRIKIISASNIIEGIITGIISLIGSAILTFTDTAHANIIFGIASSIIIFLLLNYMKSRVGLKPEDYPQHDIDFKEVK